MKPGDKFHTAVKPKNFPHLYKKNLTVGITWCDGSVMPVEEFCVIPKEHIKVSWWNKFINLLNR